MKGERENDNALLFSFAISMGERWRRNRREGTVFFCHIVCVVVVVIVVVMVAISRCDFPLSLFCPRDDDDFFLFFFFFGRRGVQLEISDSASEGEAETEAVGIGS